MAHSAHNTNFIKLLCGGKYVKTRFDLDCGGKDVISSVDKPHNVLGLIFMGERT